MRNVIFYWVFALIFLFSHCAKTPLNSIDDEDIDWKPSRPATPVAEKPKILWMDASANFKYLANNRENITLYVEKAKQAGFTEIVVDVRPSCGDVLYKSTLANQIEKLNNIDRTATWDYLEAFLEDGHKLGLKCTRM